MMKLIVPTAILSIMLTGCVRVYDENKIYSKGLNNGRIFDENAFMIEKDAIEFNKERTDTLDRYFDSRAKEILKRTDKL